MISVIIALVFAVYPFQCIPELPGLHEVEAINVYVETSLTTGYWDVPEDLHREHRPINEDGWSLWIWHSDETELYYMIVFDHRPTPAEPHPCGQGAITAQQYQEVTDALYE